MKALTISLCALFLASCASTPQSKVENAHDAVIAHMSKPKQIIGQDFDSRFEKDGLIGGEFVAIASIVDDINKNEKQMQIIAEADARSRLLNSAPTEFKKVIQAAVSTSTGDNGNVENIGITITEVHALTGLTSNMNDTQCVKYAVPNNNMNYDYKKECRTIVHVLASNLQKAYNYTLDKKYGVKEVSAIQEILKQQLTQKVLEVPVPTKPVASN
jgi:hypothetical protein